MNECEVCGRSAVVHEVSPAAAGAKVRWFCDEHSSVRVPPPAPPDAEALDEEIRDLVLALNQIDGVRTLCSCSGVHPGAVMPYVEIRSSGEDPASRARFEDFIGSLVASPERRDLFFIEHRPGGGLHLQPIRRTNAAVAWSTLLDHLGCRPPFRTAAEDPAP